MRIAALTGSYSPTVRHGGISSVLSGLQREWHAKGQASLDVWTLRGAEGADRCSLNVPRVPLEGFLGALLFAHRRLAAGYDLVFPQHAEMAFIPGRARNLCFVHTVTSVEYSPKPLWWRRVLRLVEMRGLAKADRVLCLNGRIQRELETTYRVPHEKIRQVVNGIDVQWWQQGGGRSPRAGVVFVGRLIQRKQVDFAIRVVSALAQAGVAARLTIIGEGPERPVLQQLAARLLPPHQYEFLGWRCPEETRARLHAAQVLLFPSKSEGLPMTVLEAAAAGAVPVYGRSGAEHTLQVPAPIGRFVDSWELEDWVSVLRDLLCGQTLVEALRDEARRQATLRFSQAAAAEAVLRECRAVLG